MVWYTVLLDPGPFLTNRAVPMQRVPLGSLELLEEKRKPFGDYGMAYCFN